MSLASMALPLKLKAVLRAITKLLWMRDSSVVKYSVTPSAKYSWFGSFERLVKGRTTMESRAASAGGGVVATTGAVRLPARRYHAPAASNTINAAIPSASQRAVLRAPF